MGSSYDSSEEELDIEEEENLAMILAMHINKNPKHGGSFMGRQNIWRDRIDAHNRLIRHYFADNPMYPESYFWRRFRMSTELFRCIADRLASHDRFFSKGGMSRESLSIAPFRR